MNTSNESTVGLPPVVELRMPVSVNTSGSTKQVSQQQKCEQSVSKRMPADDSVTQNEVNELQEEKIAAIRRAIAAGAYDSEEILQKAFARMIQRIDDTSGL